MLRRPPEALRPMPRPPPIVPRPPRLPPAGPQVLQRHVLGLLEVAVERR